MYLTRRQRTLLGFQKGEKQPPNSALCYCKTSERISCETDEYNLILDLKKWPIVTLDYLHYFGHEKGWGKRKFRNLLSNWIHLGASEILIPHAKGRPSEREKWSGYYVWPRFGFNGKPHWKTTEKWDRKWCRDDLISLFAQAGGDKHWLLYGGSLRNLKFDLTPGSRNLEAWRTYEGRG